jgi:succinate dehydrogenase / fumarate reductase membrane anchor subunit
VSVIGLAHVDYASFKAWIGSPFNASLILITVFVTVYHGMLGVQVVIEDYVHGEANKFGSLIALKFVSVFLAVFMAVSILKVAVGV